MNYYFSRLSLFKLFFRENVAEKKLYVHGLVPPRICVFIIFNSNRQMSLFRVHSCQYCESSPYLLLFITFHKVKIN